jgi:hypothetical protein
LTLVLGASDANGIAPLSLKNDVTLSMDIGEIGSCVCLKLFGAGSLGSIDCDGGTAYDTTVVQDPNSPDDPWTVQTAQGMPAQAGNGNLLVSGYMQLFEGTCAVVDCDNQTYTSPLNIFPFTTTQSTVVENGPWTTGGGGAGLAAPFDCANFSVPGSGGALVSGVAFAINGLFETAEALRLEE